MSPPEDRSERRLAALLVADVKPVAGLAEG